VTVTAPTLRRVVTNDNGPDECPERLNNALRQMNASLEQQQSVISRYRDVNKTLATEIATLRKSLISYQRDLKQVDVTWLGNRARRLAVTMAN
jgi:hypothetical protein